MRINLMIHIPLKEEDKDDVNVLECYVEFKDEIKEETADENIYTALIKTELAGKYILYQLLFTVIEVVFCFIIF